MVVKDTLRDIKTDTKEAARKVDGHQLRDDVGNSGDRIRDGLGKFGTKSETRPIRKRRQTVLSPEGRRGPGGSSRSRVELPERRS